MEQITAQIEHLRRRLASKTRKDYTSDYRYERWRKQSRDLIDKLLGELSALDEPGEYDELPSAVVADELGLRLDQVRLLIKLGDIEASGERAHELVSRRELERLAQLGVDEILRRSGQSTEDIYSETVSQLRGGDLEAAERSYRRLKARQSCVGNHALAAEVAIKLAKGLYEDVEQLIRFILGDKHRDSALIGTYLGEFIRGVCFKNQNLGADAVGLLTPIIGDEIKGAAQTGRVADDLQVTAMCVTTVVMEGLGGFVGNSSTVGREGELYKIVRDRVFSVLYAEANMSGSMENRTFILSVKQRLPRYWKPAELLDELREG